MQFLKSKYIYILCANHFPITAGTALPICLITSFSVPENKKVSGKLFNRWYSKFVYGRLLEPSSTNLVDLSFE